MVASENVGRKDESIGVEFHYDFGPKDFKHKDVDGLGENWPISYEELKPFYDRLDKLVGVFGNK